MISKYVLNVFYQKKTLTLSYGNIGLNGLQKWGLTSMIDLNHSKPRFES